MASKSVLQKCAAAASKSSIRFSSAASPHEIFSPATDCLLRSAITRDVQDNVLAFGAMMKEASSSATDFFVSESSRDLKDLDRVLHSLNAPQVSTFSLH
jgi:hypothetical protein